MEGPCTRPHPFLQPTCRLPPHPDALLELARVPESAHGERDPAEDWGPGTSFFINCALNCQRLLHNMAQVRLLEGGWSARAGAGWHGLPVH